MPNVEKVEKCSKKPLFKAILSQKFSMWTNFKG